jgi:deoxyxylulose-5-phosphate synthase
MGACSFIAKAVTTAGIAAAGIAAWEHSLFLNHRVDTFFTDIAIQNRVKSIIVHSTT